MNKAFFSNFKRFIATLLVIITLMGMLPLTASASAKGNTHSKSINQSIKTTSGSGGGYEDDTYNYDQGRFTRFTLVRFPFSDETPNNKSVSEWASGTVVGSVDILTDGVVPAGTKYFKVKGSNLLSNAFSYRNGKETEIVDGYSFEPLFGELPAYPTSNLYEPLRYSDDDGDPMMYRFGSINGAIPNPDTDQWCINSTFNKVIKLIVDRTSNSDARTELTADYDANTFTIWDKENKRTVLASTVSEDFRYAYNFVASAANNGSCYRLLVEPGVITQLPYGTDEGHESMAATLRDIASVLLIQENEITCGNAANGYGTANGEYEGEMVYICNQTKNNWVGSNSVLGMWSWRNVQQYWFVFRSFFRLQRQALGLYNTDNTFRTYTVQKDADGNITNVLFNQTPDGQAFFGHVSNEMADAFFEVWSYEIEDYQCRKYSSYAIAQYVLDIWKRGEGMMGWVGRGRAGCLNSPVFNEGTYPALGLGVIEPGSIVGSITVTDKITVKKVVAGDKTADLKAYKSSYDFEISIPKSTYDTLITAGVTFSDSDSGAAVSFTENGENWVYTFALTDGASKTIKFDNIPESLSSTINESFNCTITEKDVDDLYDHFKDNDPPFALYINESSTKDDDGVIENVKLGSTTVFKNQLGEGPGEGSLHLIVDYNFPGAQATTGPVDLDGNNNIVDCGGAAPDSDIPVSLEINGIPLIAGVTEMQIPGSEVKLRFTGLYTSPTSTEDAGIGNNGYLVSTPGSSQYTYHTPKNVQDKLLILYAHWEVVPNKEENKEEIIVIPTPGAKSNVYTVYWDMGAGFDGGGITSQTCGQIVIPQLTLSACHSSNYRPEIKIDFGFDPPDIDHALSHHRMGCWFIGWLPHDASYGKYNYLGFVGTSMQCEVYNEGNTILGRLLVHGEDWLPYINDHPEAPGKSTTYHAIWVGQQYSFDANGGYYPTESDRTHEGVTYQGIPEESTEGKGILKGLPDYDDSWFGDFFDNDGNPRAHRLKCATVRQNANGCWDAWYVPRIEPIRTGYTFTGWYWDPHCSVPVTRNEEGFIPGRIYFAGWEAEPVYVTYYDTREGNSVVTVQKYNYDDMIKLSDKMSSTIGWTFSGWGAPNLPVRDKANEAEPEPPTQDSMGNFVESMKAMERFVPTILDVGILTCHDGRYEDGNGGGNAHGSPEELEDMSGEGQGVISGKHYWTLDLYSLWNQDYADYVATFNFNDYNNNDGARPKKITVGVVDSITNREVASTEVDLTINGRDSAQSFSMPIATNLAMTNNNSSTERVKYYMYLKDYTDIDDTKYIIQDTSASTGEIALASVSNADTSPVASYRYTINQVNMQGNVTDQPNLAPDDTSVKHDNDGVYTGIMYFDHNLMTTGDDIEITIRWNDQSDNDGMRPETLKLTLMGCDRNGNWIPVQDWTAPGKGQIHQSNSGVVYVNSGICDVSDNGNVWTYIFKDFQKYDNKNYIKYAVRIEGYEEYSYTASTTGYVEDGIVLSYEPVKAPVPVDIYWHDNTNQDGMRPDSVVVQLIAHQWNRDLGAYESVVVNAKRFTGFSSTSNLWSSSFDNMPVYHDGQPILYHLVVASDLNGNIDDDSNPYTWSEGISGSPYKDGARPSVDIYHNADERSVTATVQWDDMLNNDGKRPDSITLQLYANNEPVPGDEYCVVLTGDPKALTWTYTFDHLDVYTNKRTGQEIIYKVKIIDAQGGEFESYTPSYINKYGAFVETFGASGEAFVLMSYKPKTGTVSGAVYWQDDGNRDGERPEFDKWRLTALNFFAFQREHAPLQENSGSISTAMSFLWPIFSLFWPIMYHKPASFP